MLASRSLSRLSSIGMLVSNLMLDRTASSSAMYFSVLFGESIVTIKMGKSTRSCLDVLVFLGLLKNIKLLTNIPIEDKWPRLREADGLSLESFHKKYSFFHSRGLMNPLGSDNNHGEGPTIIQCLQKHLNTLYAWIARVESHYQFTSTCLKSHIILEHTSILKAQRGQNV